MCGIRVLYKALTNSSPSLQEYALGLFAFLVDVFVPWEFAVKRQSEKFCCVTYFRNQIIKNQMLYIDCRRHSYIQFPLSQATGCFNSKIRSSHVNFVWLLRPINKSCHLFCFWAGFYVSPFSTSRSSMTRWRYCRSGGLPDIWHLLLPGLTFNR